jgi:pimeloyl-ACP methyl ester carboxylesterase
MNDGLERRGFGVASSDEPVYFPSDENTYCGIISIPTSTSGSMSTTGVVLLAGTGPGSGTIGRNRMWVRLARTLADEGTPVLRFDYAGVGDSSGEMIGYDLDTPAVEALQAAFDVLESIGCEDIIVVGTCYGARTALAGSAGDPRVAGIHLMVPPVKSSAKGSAGVEHLAGYASSRTIARKAVEPRTIKRLLKSKGARKAARRFVAVKARKAVGTSTESRSRRIDTTKEASPGFQRPLHQLLVDGVPVHILFGMDDFYWTEFKEAARGRLGEDLQEFSDLIDVKTIPGVLRGFPSMRIQDLAIESVVSWVQERSSGRRSEPVTMADMHTRNGGPEDSSEDVTYFGNAPRLYGVTHLPNGDRRASVVICSSIHAELLKSYRIEVLLARALAAHGFAVHRFHYCGAGNSEAEGDELTLPAMIEAGRQTTERIVGLAGTNKLVFVGIRIGAYPATVLAAESGGAPLILWDPVLDTDRFMKDALRTHAIAAIKGEAKPESVQESLARLDRDGSIDLLGYELRSEFHTSIRGKKLSDYSPQGSRVLVVPFGSLDVEPLAQTWGRRGIEVTNIGKADRAAWWLVEDNTKEQQERGAALASRTADWIAATS